MKKWLVGLFLSLFMASFVCIASANAAGTKTYDDTNKSSWTLTDENVTSIYGMNHKLLKGVTETSGNKADQKINLFEMKTDGVNSKLVTWAPHTYLDGYSRIGLSKIAKNYEENHPGWIVIGGINADQYYQKFGGNLGQDGSYYYPTQPYYPLIMDGERRFPIMPYGITSNFIGFANNGAASSFVYPTGLAGVSLSIINESGDVLQKLPVNHINKTPGAGETTVWSPYYSTELSNTIVEKNVQSANDIYIVGRAELAYMNNSVDYPGGSDSFFGRGVISSIAKATTLGKWQFAIDSSNAAVTNALQEGSRIVVQYDYLNEAMNQVEAASGYHSVQRFNGKDITDPSTANNDYNARQYNRSVFGKKADGTYVLMTADRSNAGASEQNRGLNFTETNAVLKQNGIVEAYQDDGGGSVTAIVRNQFGNFDVVNSSSDSSSPTAERSILTGLFFVVRDPGYYINHNRSTRTTITLCQDETLYSDCISDVKAIVDGKTFAVTSKETVLSGLKENTEYEIILNYKVTDPKNPSKAVNATHRFKAKTEAFSMPDPGFTIPKVTEQGFIVQKQATETSGWIQEVVIHVGDQTFTMGSDQSFEVKGMNKATTYQVFFEYVVVEPDTGNRYNGTTEITSITTFAFALPTIDKFNLVSKTNQEVVLQYRYNDPDDGAKRAYIQYSGKKIELTKKLGNITISDLDIKKADYQFQLVVEYEDADGNVYKVESEIIGVEQTKKGCKCKASQESLGFLFGVVTIGLLFIKRKQQ